MPTSLSFPGSHDQDLFIGLFIGVICVIGATLLPHLLEWFDNSQQSVQRIYARVIAKRVNIYGSVHSQTGIQTTTTYYVTFEFDNQERRELTVSGPEYGMLVEGDVGILEFQGTQYHGFERERLQKKA